MVSEVEQDVASRATTKEALGEIRLVVRWNDDAEVATADVLAEVEPPKAKRKRSRD